MKGNKSIGVELRYAPRAIGIMPTLSKKEKRWRLVAAVACGLVGGLILIAAIRVAAPFIFSWPVTAVVEFFNAFPRLPLVLMPVPVFPSVTSLPSSSPPIVPAAPEAAAVPASISSPASAASSSPAIADIASSPSLPGTVSTVGASPSSQSSPPVSAPVSDPVPSLPPSTAAPISTAPSPSEAQPAPAPSSPPPLSATYTEGFFGTGYEDGNNTTAYEDYTATAISLAPDYAVSPAGQISPADETAPANLMGQIDQVGGVYVAHIPAFPDLVVTSTYSGIVRFGYDSQTRKTLIIYAAYESRVLEMGPMDSTGKIGLIADYSARFSPRAFGGGAAGSLAVRPVIFAQDGAWWIFSGQGSEEPKFMKIQNGAVIDYTQAFPGEAILSAKSGLASHEIYVIGNMGSYLFTDRGFARKTVQWESVKLNSWTGTVVAGEIARLDIGGDDAPSRAGSVQTFVSNDGGATWMPAVLSQNVPFAGPGGDFRFKVAITPGSDPYATPWVEALGVQYWVQRN